SNLSFHILSFLSTFKILDLLLFHRCYDGWILVNLYPKRTKKVSFLEREPDKNLFWQNLNLIRSIVSENQFGFDKVWLAWGNDIDARHHVYLKESAYYLCTMLLELNLDFVSVEPIFPGIPRIQVHRQWPKSLEKSHRILSLYLLTLRVIR
uniref:DUF1643 domain-containing protein n=1 Tax=Ulvibacterium marinum TaxID=2419782 RepID=UPI002494A650